MLLWRVLRGRQQLQLRRRLHALTSRGVLRVRGDDGAGFLQGLVTADTTRLQDSPLLYTLMLNARGRVLFDLFLYGGGADDLYVDADRRLLSRLRSLLLIYRVRRRLLVDDVSDSCACVAALPGEDGGDEQLVAGGVDPRLPELGRRLLVPRHAGDADSAGEVRLRALRHRLGVAEGADEIPHGACTPLEYNADWLGEAVSFQKGCYVGQELTARTRHTGVVRKRVMPVRWGSTGDAVDCDVRNAADRKLGRVLASCGSHGLALLRVSQALSCTELHAVTPHQPHPTLTAHAPHWWPKEATQSL